MSEEIKNTRPSQETITLSAKQSDLVLKSQSNFEIRQGDGKFLFEFNTKIESENETAFMEIWRGFDQFVQTLKRSTRPPQ